jgi:hypothetical protein
MFGESSGIIGILRMTLSFAEYLQSRSLALAVVESKSIASRSNGHYTDGHTNFDIVEDLSLLEMIVLLQKFAHTRIDVELVWVRVRALGLAEVVDVSRSNLEVLLVQLARLLKSKQRMFVH